MKKISTAQILGNEIFKEQKLTIGVDLGDRWSFYCVLDEAGKIILEQKVPTTPEAIKQAFGKMPQSLIALETGTHSPWVSRLLTELGYKVIVAHAQKVQLITKSNRKDDRHDARTLARLVRIDPELLGPVRHRSAKAQIHLTVIRARAELVSARTALVNAARGLVKSFGERLPQCGTYQVSEKLAEGVSAELRDVLVPLLREVESLSKRIQEYDERDVGARPRPTCAHISCQAGAIWVLFRLRASLEGSDALAILSARFLLLGSPCRGYRDSGRCSPGHLRNAHPQRTIQRRSQCGAFVRSA